MTGTARPGSGRVLAGRYRLDRHLASGGMAEVWEATDQVLGRPVAVKILHSHLGDDPAFQARFRHEAVAAARLVHPAIVAIYDTCHTEDADAIVMELVRGRTLRDYLDERGRLDPVEVVHVGSEVASALSCAHRAGIVHRDVKPANILLSDDGRVLVTDFGIAKVLDEPDLTRTSQLLGTVKYLAPEQVEGGAVDARTDVYALGAVLYECLCGEPPFRADNPAALALARLHRDPPPPHDVVAGVPPELERALVRSLKRHPDERFTTADDLRTALLSTRLDSWDDLTTVTGSQVPVAAAAGATTGTTDPTRAAAGSTWLPAGQGPPRAPAPAPRRRGPTAGVVVSLVVVLALLLVALLVATTDVGQQIFDNVRPEQGTPETATVVPIVRVNSFDPEVRDVENEELVGNTIDGNPATTWRTDRYETRKFGNLKSGVGLIVQLDGVHSLDRIVVDSPTTGWAAQIHVSQGGAPTLDGWGQPLDRADGIAGGTTTFDLHGAEGDQVLIWITDLGADRVEIAEIALAG
ncbi:MAG TPA: protein kinase [Acidimicrobiales bacterium]